MLPVGKQDEAVPVVQEGSRTGSVVNVRRTLANISRSVPITSWGTVVVQADGGVRVHLREEVAMRGTRGGGHGKREAAFQRKIWLTGKESKRFKRIFFFHEKRMGKALKLYAFFAWGSFCVAHMRANPDWVRSRRSQLDDEEGAPEAKCVPSPTVSSAAAVEGKASHQGTVNSMAELASNADAVSPPSVKLTMDDQPSSAQSSPPSTRSKAKKKNSTK